MAKARLDGKVAVISGATAGIGRAITLELASRGAHVVGTARNPEPAAQLAEEAQAAGGGFTFVKADVSSWAECKRTIHATLEKHGRIDVLINNAGISRPHGRMDEVEEADWRAVSSVTLEGTIALTRYALPAMIAQQDGVILHIASVSAISGLENMGSYCMSKAAVVQHARVVAIETRGTGVRCNALLVGATETEAMKKSLLSLGKKLHGDDWTPEAGKGGRHGASKTMQPEELARAVALLCLDDAREINGSTIALDRGFSAGLFNSEYNRLSAAGLIPQE